MWLGDGSFLRSHIIEFLGFLGEFILSGISKFQKRVRNADEVSGIFRIEIGNFITGMNIPSHPDGDLWL